MLLSVLGFGLLLWAIIEAPSRTWTAPPVIGALAASAALIAGFLIWEHRRTDPMLPVSFFRNRRYSAAIASLALVLFALMGVLFLMTQYLQFVLGFSAFHAGLAIGPIALVLLATVPFPAVLARKIGTKSVVVPGLLLIALGLGFVSQTTVTDSYAWSLPFLLLIGCGVGLALAPSTDSVMGSVPQRPAVGANDPVTALAQGVPSGWGGVHMNDHQHAAIEQARIAWHDHQFEHDCYGRDCAEDLRLYRAYQRAINGDLAGPGPATRPPPAQAGS